MHEDDLRWYRDVVEDWHRQFHGQWLDLADCAVYVTLNPWLGALYWIFDRAKDMGQAIDEIEWCWP